MNDQRKVIYGQRSDLIADNKDFSEEINDMRLEVANDIIFGNVPENTPSEFWDYKLLNEELAAHFGSDISLSNEENLTRDNAVDLVFEKIKEKTRSKEKLYHPEMTRYMERAVLLRLIDQYWKEHLLNLDKLRQGINLRAYGQRDPLNEYKQEAFMLFEMMAKTIRKETVKILSLFELPKAVQEEDVSAALLGDQPKTIEVDLNEAQPPLEISRNSPCPCGSGEKYKHCCGKNGVNR
jgi:preprotein translocase subunit SecA